MCIYIYIYIYIYTYKYMYIHIDAQNRRRSTPGVGFGALRTKLLKNMRFRLSRLKHVLKVLLRVKRCGAFMVVLRQPIEELV